VTRRLLRLALAVPLLAVGIGTVSAAARLGPAEPLCVQAASSYHAGIVVELGNGQVVRQCVGFNTSTITALSVLEGSHIEYETASYGGLGDAVCQIDNEPPSYTSCLPSSGSYWVFFISRGGGAWTNSPQGVSVATVGDGDDVGFRYDPLAGADPQPASPAGTCATPTPTPAPTRTPVPTPRPTTKPTPGGTAPARTGSPVTQAGTTQPPTPTTTTCPTLVPGSAAAGTAPTSSAASPVSVADLAPAAAISGPFTPGLVLAACVVAALLALLGVQGMRRRRR
jgi:hypothetical protein